MRGAFEAWAQSRYEPSRRKAWLIVLTLAAILALLLWLFLPRRTPFQASMDATTLEFTFDTGSSARYVTNFLASAASVDLTVTCERFWYLNAPGAPAHPCTDGETTFHDVALTSIAFNRGTSAKLSVEHQGLSLLLTRTNTGPDFVVTVMAGKDSSVDGSNGNSDKLGPGEWAASTAAEGCTLNLRELAKGGLSSPESDIRIADRSDVLFATEDPAQSSLVGRSSTLLFPELPASNDAAPLGNGQLTIHDFVHGFVRELAINRNSSNEPRSLHVVLTGTSRHIDWKNPFDDEVENQALRAYDIILRIRHQPFMLGVIGTLALVFGVLGTLVSTLDGLHHLLHPKKILHKILHPENG